MTAHILNADAVKNFVLKGKCFVCAKETSTQCGHCKKIYYCGKNCQSLHRKEHKEDCFPLDLLTVSGDRRPYFVATREIKAGEKLFSEASLISGPSCKLPTHYPSCKDEDDDDDTFYPICLSCYIRMEFSSFNGFYRKCIKCGWSLCSEDCENNPVHADAECKIFAASRTHPIDDALEYNSIVLLRILLLKNKEPRKWQKFCSIPATKDAGDSSSLKNITRFLRVTWSLNQFDEEIIQFVHEIYTSRVSTPVSNRTERIRSAVYMHYKMHFFAHSCIPNSESLSGQASYKNGFWEKYFAITDIPKGTRMTAFNTVDGIEMATISRRRFIKMVQNFTCECTRCSDPTELESFFSAVKCPSSIKGCHNDDNQNIGYLMPKDSLEERSIWICNSPRCQKKISLPEITNILTSIEVETSKLQHEIKERLLEFSNLKTGEILSTKTIILNEDDFEFIDMIRKRIEKIEKSLHPNHHLLFPLKEHLLMFLSVIFNNVTRIVPNPRNRRSLLKLVEKTSKCCLDITKKLLTTIEGRLERGMFFLALSKWYLAEFTPESFNCNRLEGYLKKIAQQLAALQLLPEIEEIFRKRRNAYHNRRNHIEQSYLEHLQRCNKITKKVLKKLFTDGIFLDYHGEKFKKAFVLCPTIRGKPFETAVYIAFVMILMKGLH